MVTQRIYLTNLQMESVRGEVLKKQDIFKFRGEEKLLNFNLAKFPENLLQFTPKSFLMLHGLTPYGFLQDLRLIREMATALQRSCSFKLYKENIPSCDKDEIIKREEMLSRFLLKSEQNKQIYLNQVALAYDDSEELRGELAESLNNTFAEGLTRNGFICMPDGSLKPKVSRLFYKRGFRVPNRLKIENSNLCRKAFVFKKI